MDASFNRRQALMEDKPRFKTRSDGGEPSIEDNIQWKTTFYEIQQMKEETYPMKDNL